MGDIKLFRLSDGDATEVPGEAVAIERTLQTLMERNLDALLGVHLLESEYSTGKTHGGRIDSLGIDENGAPVIIEYKRSLNENVINQGLFYLDWLMDHKAEFSMLVMQKVGGDAQDRIDWNSPRLLCIAGDFTRYDQHAVAQIDRNIELLRYRRYSDDLLLLELVNDVRRSTITSSSAEGGISGAPRVSKSDRYATFAQLRDQADQHLRAVYENLRTLLLALGDDVQEKELKSYAAFRRIKNFACVEVHPQAGKLLVYIKVDPDSVELVPGFARDVRSIGHFGTGDLELTIASSEDLERAKAFLSLSYEAS